jgi:hypothetical protein
MTKRLLDFDQSTGMATYFHYNDATDETILETVQDHRHEVEASTQLQNDDEYTRKGMKNDMLHYAHIPDEVLLRWHSMGININDRKELFNMVNKPEWSRLKTTRMMHK